jgi:hypothetical protein
MSTTTYTPSMLRGAGTRGVPEVPGASSFTNTYSLAFDGINDYVNCGNETSRQVQTLTMSVWVKPTAFARDTIFLNGQSGTGNKGIEIFWVFNVFYARINGTTQVLGAGNGQNNWTHLIIAYDGTTLKMMVDGVQGADVNISQTIDYTSYNGLLIGLGPYGYHIGNIDEVAFWDSDQSANFSTIYGAGVPNDISALNPLNWYRMGEDATWDGSNWTLTDQGSGENDATSANMVEADRETNTP